jgi:hypothetical protein
MRQAEYNVRKCIIHTKIANDGHYLKIDKQKYVYVLIYWSVVV